MIFDFGELDAIELDVPLPSTLLQVRQVLDPPRLDDVAGAVRAELDASGLAAQVKPGDSIAVGVGSRGVANIPLLAKTVCSWFADLGAKPFVIPAMGSHGGATAEGQADMLGQLGVTEASVGVPIVSTMEVAEIGRLDDGPPLFCDVNAIAADHTFLINRVKPHTDFHGDLESGLAKMCVIGLGKRHGASIMHAGGGAAFRRWLAPAARIYETNTNLLGGLAVVENAHDDTAIARVLPAAQIGTPVEGELLSEAKRLLMRMPFDIVDVLVLKAIGKNISGTGMDTNVIGRVLIPREAEPATPDIAAIAVLDLTEPTHGNASGIGLANVTTWRAAAAIDWTATYMNCLTSGIFGIARVGLPIVMTDDRRAISVAVNGCAQPLDAARIVFAADTLHVNQVWVAPWMADEIAGREDLIVEREVPLSFDGGRLTSPWSMPAIK